MKRLIFAFCLLAASIAGNAQVSPGIALSDSAKLFGPDVISTGDFEFNASFTPNSKTVFFSRASVNFGFIAIFYAVQRNGHWKNPKAVRFTGTYRDTDPFVSNDGKRLYFSSDRPLNGNSFKDYDYHYFYVELEGNKVVSEPLPLSLPLPAGMKPSYLSFAKNGDAYFFSVDPNNDADIYFCPFKDGVYQAPVSLPFNDKKMFDFDPVISADERFIIFCSNTRKGLGSGDLWVSFKKGDSWTEPENLGSKVNTKGNDGAPGLSRDNKTLYFTSFREKADRPIYKNGKATTEAILELLHSPKNGLRNIYEIDISSLSK